MTTTVNVGDRVRWSGAALEHDRMYYLGLGDYARRQRAKDSYLAKIALRGTVTAVDTTQPCGVPITCVTVRWDDKATTQSMAHRIVSA